MGRKKFAWIFLASLAVVLAAGQPASAKNQHRLNLYNEEMQGSTKLAPGEYLIRWETHSPEATVTFYLNRKAAGTMTGKVVERNTKFDQNVIIDDPGPNGSRRLVEIDLGGTNKSIVFNQ